jgi:hypothetical protein
MMNKSNVYILIHSPLVGGLTWTLVANELRQRGFDVLVPILEDSIDSEEPFWKQHADSVSAALAQVPKTSSVTLVAHSGAGPLLPAIRHSSAHPVSAYVFVDAGIPRHGGATRLDLMRSEDPEWAAQFQEELERGECFPNWSFDDLQKVLPDEALRKQMVAEIRSRGATFFTEAIPVFDGWPDAPCMYIQFSTAYQRPATWARQAGWQTYELEAGHFHMLVDPAAVTDLIVKSANKLGRQD